MASGSDSASYLYVGLTVLWTLRVRAGFAAVTCDVACALLYEGQGAQVRVVRQLHSRGAHIMPSLPSMHPSCLRGVKFYP